MLSIRPTEQDRERSPQAHGDVKTRGAKCKKPEQYHYVAPNAYQAAFVADHHDADQVALTCAIVADVCAGSQSATHAMGMIRVRSVPLDERTEVDTGWVMGKDAQRTP